jgi:hypothetical protein
MAVTTRVNDAMAEPVIDPWSEYPHHLAGLAHRLSMARAASGLGVVVVFGPAFTGIS